MLSRRQIAFVACALLLTVFAMRLIEHLVSHDYNEAFEAICLNASLNLADGGSLYPPASARPFSVYVHSPLGSVIGAMAARLSFSRNTHLRIVAIRLVSFLALLAAAWTLWRGVIAPAGVGASLFALTLCFALSKFADYATTGRNDMLSMLAEMATLAAFLAWHRRPAFGRLALFALAAIISVYTRQMGIVIAGSALLSLAIERRFLDAALGVAMMVLPAAAIFLLLNHLTDGAFYQHLIAYNIRPYSLVASRDSILLQPTTLSFFASYVLFGALALAGYRGRDTLLVLRIAFPLSFAMSALLFFRPGGDVNYFFETILIGILFSARGWQRLATSRWLMPVALAQVLLIVAVVGKKTQSSWSRAFYPYETVARTIREEFPGETGWVIGRQGDSLAVHLRGWSVHGPDVTTGAPVAYYCLPRTRWIFERLKDDFASGKLHTVVVAEKGCAASSSFTLPPEVSGPTPRSAFLARQFDDTICVYRTGDSSSGNSCTASE